MTTTENMLEAVPMYRVSDNAQCMAMRRSPGDTCSGNTRAMSAFATSFRWGVKLVDANTSGAFTFSYRGYLWAVDQGAWLVLTDDSMTVVDHDVMCAEYITETDQIAENPTYKTIVHNKAGDWTFNDHDDDDAFKRYCWARRTFDGSVETYDTNGELLYGDPLFIQIGAVAIVVVFAAIVGSLFYWGVS